MQAPFRWLVRNVPPHVLALIAVVALVAGASGLSTLAEAQPSPSPSPVASTVATPLATPTARVESPAPPTSSATPVALGTAPDVGGVIFQANAGVWRYDGARGTVTWIARYGRPTADGAHYIVWLDLKEGTLTDGTPTLIDAATGSMVAIAPKGARDVDWIVTDLLGVSIGDTVSIGARGPFSAPGASWIRLSPDGGRAVVGSAGSALPFVLDVHTGARRMFGLPGASAVGWSPDGRLFAYTVPNEGTAARDGVRVRVFDLETSRDVDLGVTLTPAWRMSWCAPHALAFSNGPGRETWQNKTLRVWSPERGSDAITEVGRVGLSPSCSGDGHTLYSIVAPEAAYDPLEFFAGSGAGARAIEAYDAADRSSLGFVEPRIGYAAEGVRASLDGKLLLTVQRRTMIGVRPSDIHVSLELVAVTIDGRQSTRLARIGSDVGFGYYGSYTGPEDMAWSR